MEPTEGPTETFPSVVIESATPRPRGGAPRRRARIVILRRLLIAFALCAASLLAAGEFSGRRAPGFALYDSQFKFHDPQDYRGKILLIDFMQTTCPHCATLTDILEKVKAKFPGKVEVISIVNPPDTTGTMARYAAAHKVTGPLVFDCGQAAASYLAVKGNTSVTVPHLFLVDAQGIIRNDWAYDLLGPRHFRGRGVVFRGPDACSPAIPARRNSRSCLYWKT